MKKLFIFIIITTLYLFGVWNFEAQSHDSVHADEIINKNKLAERSIQLVEKENTHKRFLTKEKDIVKRTVKVEATAYTAFCEGCSGTTSTGINLKANPDKKVIAVDPDVIPLGSTVRVPGYGVAVAGDIGGDIEGHRIDVFIPQHENAIDFGRRQIEVEILSS